MPAPRPPIADPLGSGEATLLRRLLAEAQRLGPRPASSVNAFGVGGVAGALPREIADADVSALTADCVCGGGVEGAATCPNRREEG